MFSWSWTLNAFFSATTEGLDLVFAPLERGDSLSMDAIKNVCKFILPGEKHEMWCSELFDVLQYIFI